MHSDFAKNNKNPAVCGIFEQVLHEDCRKNVNKADINSNAKLERYFQLFFPEIYQAHFAHHLVPRVTILLVQLRVFLFRSGRDGRRFSLDRDRNFSQN